MAQVRFYHTDRRRKSAFWVPLVAQDLTLKTDLRR